MCCLFNLLSGLLLLHCGLSLQLHLEFLHELLLQQPVLPLLLLLDDQGHRELLAHVLLDQLLYRILRFDEHLS